MREFVWRFRFAFHLWRRGVDWRSASGSAWGGDYDPEYSPEGAADDELSYMADDAE